MYTEWLSTWYITYLIQSERLRMLGNLLRREYSPPSLNLVFSIIRVYLVLSLLSLFTCTRYLDGTNDTLFAVRILGCPWPQLKMMENGSCIQNCNSFNKCHLLVIHRGGIKAGFLSAFMIFFRKNKKNALKQINF